MLDRRSVLRRGAGAISAAALATGAGCLFDDGNGGGDGSDAGFLGTLPDPTPAVPPGFHAAYSYDPATLRDELGADPMPDLAGNLVAIVGQMDGTAVVDLDRLSGQTVRQVGHSGTDLEIVAPSGTDLVAKGAIDVDGAAEWLSGQGLTDLGDARGYRRFGNAGSIPEGFAVDGDALLFGNRKETDLDAAAITSASIDGLEDGSAAAAGISPDLVAVVDALPDGTATAATGFDLVAERPDTGTDAYDAAASSLVAAGISASVDGDETHVTRVLRYRRDRVAQVEDVQAAVDAASASATGHFEAGDWAVSARERSIRIEGSVSTSALAEAPELLRRAVPVPAYDDLTNPVDPRELGRDAPPRASWAPELLDDGRVAIVHAGGPTVEDLTVAYAVDGERVTEPWEGPVEPEDRFETAEAPDDGSLLDLVWASGTANETILFRSELQGGG